MEVTGMFDEKFQNCFYALFSQILVFIRNTLWPKINSLTQTETDFGLVMIIIYYLFILLNWMDRLK